MVSLNKKINSIKEEINKLDKKISGCEEKRNNLKEKLSLLQNEKAAIEMKKFNEIISKKGLKMNDIVDALSAGNIDKLKDKIIQEDTKEETK